MQLGSNNKVILETLNTTEARAYLNYLSFKIDQHYRDNAEIEDVVADMGERHDTEGTIMKESWQKLALSDKEEHQGHIEADEALIKKVKERFNL